MNETKRPVPWTAIILAVAAVLVAAIIGGVMYVNAKSARNVVTCRNEPRSPSVLSDATEHTVCRDSQGNQVFRP
jgi:hypothetical protein